MKALSPIILFLVLYVGISVITGDFYKVPVSVAFLIATVYAVAISKGSMQERVAVLSRGAGQPTVLLMVWIYLLAGAFAASAKAMGAVDSTVGFTMHILPPEFILPGIFLAACFISLAIGTSVGTVAALTPVAAGIAQTSDLNMALMVGVVVGGAFFGDNLSVISDTTIAATQTQGCKMRDKLRTNLWLVAPVAVIVTILYWLMSDGLQFPSNLPQVSFLKLIPYLVVIITAILGLNVMMVLLLGLVLTLVIGVIDGVYDIFGWMQAVGSGMDDMGSLIIMAILAAALLELVNELGGIRTLIVFLTRRISGRRGAEASIAMLVMLVNVCTANNTVSIITTGPIARDIAQRYGISPKRSASLMDTMSCFTQSLLPYSAQLLVAAGVVQATTGSVFNPATVVPFLIYPMGIGLAVIVSILIGSKTTNR